MSVNNFKNGKLLFTILTVGTLVATSCRSEKKAEDKEVELEKKEVSIETEEKTIVKESSQEKMMDEESAVSKSDTKDVDQKNEISTVVEKTTSESVKEKVTSQKTTTVKTTKKKTVKKEVVKKVEKKKTKVVEKTSDVVYSPKHRLVENVVLQNNRVTIRTKKNADGTIQKQYFDAKGFLTKEIELTAANNIISEATIRRKMNGDPVEQIVKDKNNTTISQTNWLYHNGMLQQKDVLINGNSNSEYYKYHKEQLKSKEDLNWLSKYEYDKNGLLKKEIITEKHVSHKPEVVTVDYKYNKYGWVINKKEASRAGTVVSDFEYDSKGKMTKERLDYGYGIKSKKLYSYDNKGLLNKIIEERKQTASNKTNVGEISQQVVISYDY